MTPTHATPMPEGRAFIDLLNDIESQVDPSSCKYIYFNYWPIIRFMINANRKNILTKSNQPLPTLTRRKQIYLYIKAIITRSTGTAFLTDVSSRASDRNLDEWLSNLSPVDILFLTRKAQYRRTFDGFCVEPFTDGIRYLNNENWTELTLVDEDPRNGSDAFLVETKIADSPAMQTLVNLKKPRDLAALWARDRITKTVAKVNNAIPNKYADLRLDESDVITRVMRSSQRYMYWVALLNQTRPKAIFLSSFTGVHYICAAGKHLGIPIVDIQHGGMHSNHPLAANWKHTPKTGYELLPDVFWCWDERSADYINKTSEGQLHAVTGGNPKIALEYNLLRASSKSKSYPSSTYSKPQVLVGLQYGSDPMIDPHVKQAYLATRDRVDWRFRLHPMGWSFLDEVVKEFGVSESSVREESLRPLHQVLPEIDLMLCNASTIIHEAIDHGAAGAVWSHKGALIFDDLVSQDKISVATDYKSLLIVLAGLNKTDTIASAQPSSKQRQQKNLEAVTKTYSALIAP